MKADGDMFLMAFGRFEHYVHEMFPRAFFSWSGPYDLSGAIFGEHRPAKVLFFEDAAIASLERRLGRGKRRIIKLL